MKLHLQQAMPYKKAPFTANDSEQAYKAMIAYLDASEVGSEGCLALSSTLSLFAIGVQSPPDEAMRKAVEAGLPHPKRDADFSIEIGTYAFFQLPLTDSLSELVQAIPFLSDGPNRIYLRLLKESPLVIIAQMIVAR